MRKLLRKILKLRAEGLTYPEINVWLNLPKGTAYRIARNRR